MRRLKPPTLIQWGCTHRWKEQSSKLHGDKLHRLRYYFCQRCGLRAKTREVPEVPWDVETLVALVRMLLPEGERVSLSDKGITRLPMDGLNTTLAVHGLKIHALKGHDPMRQVVCTLENGRIEEFGLFELRPLRSHTTGRARESPRQKHCASQTIGGKGMQEKGGT